MIEIRIAALLTRELNLYWLTNLAVSVFGEGLLKKKKRGALTNGEERDEDVGQEMEHFERGQNGQLGSLISYDLRQMQGLLHGRFRFDKRLCTHARVCILCICAANTVQLHLHVWLTTQS